MAIGNTYAQVKVGVDWDDKGFICWDTKPTDELNLLVASQSMSGWCDSSQWEYLVWDDGRHTPMPHYWKGTIDMTTHDAYLYLLGQGAYGVPVVPDPEFYATVTPGLTYTVIVNANVDGAAGNPAARLLAVDFFDASDVYISQVNTTLNMSGNSVISFIPPVGTNKIMIELKFLIGFGNAHTEVILNSAMLISGSPSVIPAYNSGESSVYDDITSRVLRLDSSIGYTDRFALLPDEGTATIVVNNYDRMFTPKTITDVKPGYPDNNFIDIGKAVVIIHRKDTNDGWIRAFVGFITELEIITGSRRERNVAIRCEQALKALDLHMGDIGIVPNLTVIDLIKNVYAGSGAFSPWIFPYLTLDSDTYRLDIGVLFGIEDAMDVLGTGVSVTNPGINMEWPQSLGDILRLSVDYDGGYFFVQGDGTSLFMARDYATGAAGPFPEWDYGEFTEDTYIYDSKIFNDIKLDFINQPLNTSGSPILLGSNTLRMAVGTDADILIDYDYNKAAMQGDYSYGDHITQTITTRKVSDGSIVVGGIGISFQGEYDASGRTDNSNNTGWGTGIRFRLYNYTGFQVDVTVDVTGIGMLPDDTAITAYEDADSVLAYGRRAKNYKNEFVTDNTLAAAYMTRKLAQIAWPAQYFKSVVLRPSAANTAFLGTKLGDIVQVTNEWVTDTTTGSRAVVIGKTINWEPNSLRLEFALSPVL